MLIARAALVVGGLLTLVGSGMTWTSFSFMNSGMGKTGIELGYGIVTGLLGIMIVALGVAPTRILSVQRVARLGLRTAAGVVMVTAVAFVAVRAGVGLVFDLPDFQAYGRYGLGLATTAIGGSLGIAGARMLARQTRESESS